jgi:hypothetical protein
VRSGISFLSISKKADGSRWRMLSRESPFATTSRRPKVVRHWRETSAKNRAASRAVARQMPDHI